MLETQAYRIIHTQALRGDCLIRSRYVLSNVCKRLCHHLNAQDDPASRRPTTEGMDRVRDAIQAARRNLSLHVQRAIAIQDADGNVTIDSGDLVRFGMHKLLCVWYCCNESI